MAVERHGRCVVVDLPETSLLVRPLTEGVIHFRSAPSRRWAPRRSWAVTRPDDEYPEVDFDVVSGGDGISIVTDGLITTIDDRGRVAVLDGQRTLLQDADPLGGPENRRSRWTHDMPDGRRYYGFGERTGFLEKRGRRYTCWTTDEWRHQGPSTDALYVAIPFYIALDPGGEAFGVYLDSTFRSVFDLTDLDARRMVMSTGTETLDWYVLDGPEPARVVERFSELVGRAPMPPRWALGYHQARWSYGSEAEVREIASRLRSERIPADAIHLDIDHMQDYRVFTWDTERFPDPPALTASLASMGLRTTVVVDAAIAVDPDVGVYAEGREQGMYVRSSPDCNSPDLTGYVWGGLSVLPDHTRADVRSWWGSLYRRYLDAGIAGFLNDMNEPALHDRPFDDPDSQNTEPPPETPFGDSPETTTHAEVRNVYGHLEDQATREGLLRAQPTARPFLVTRSGFAGIQRHAVVWTGDNASTWEHLEMSLPQLVNLGLSGVPIAGADIGGFFEDCPPELLVRWMQLGALYPFARNNSAKDTARQEPWAWGEPTTSRCRRAIELRYRLLPYLYTVAQEASTSGAPILRALFYHHPDDPTAADLANQAYVGPNLLIAPVVQPGKAEREVYLPAGEWFDVRTGVRDRGPGHILVSAGLDEGLPVFARGGSIVPTAAVSASTGEGSFDPLILEVYPARDGRARGRLYEDDGLSMAYENGDHRTTRFTAESTTTGRTLVRADPTGPFQVPDRTVVLRIHASGGIRKTAFVDRGGWEVEL
jgi:alpha-glucosidase